MSYYVKRKDRIEGPWETRELIAQPGVNEATQICTSQNFSDWKELGTIPELQILLQMRSTQAQLIEKKQEAELQVRELEEEYETWARDLHGKIAELNTQLAEKLKKLDDASGALDAKNRESELFKTRLRELKGQYLELKQYSEIQEKDFHKLREHLRAKASEKEEEVRALKNELEQARKRHDQREHALQESERKSRQNNWEMSRMEEQWLEVHQKNKILEEERARLEENLRKASADADAQKKRAEANEHEVREAPARAMRAEVEAAALKETLAAKEIQIQEAAKHKEDIIARLRSELEQFAESAQAAQLRRREALDRIAVIESQLKEKDLHLVTQTQEVVRLKSLNAEKEEQTSRLIGEKDIRLQELKADILDSRSELQQAAERIVREQMEHKRLDAQWRAREEELRSQRQVRENELQERIRELESQVSKYRKETDAFELNERETHRKLRKMIDKDAELHHQNERLKRVLIRKESYIENLEARLQDVSKDNKEKAAVRADPAQPATATRPRTERTRDSLSPRGFAGGERETESKPPSTLMEPRTGQTEKVHPASAGEGTASWDRWLAFLIGGLFMAAAVYLLLSGRG